MPKFQYLTSGVTFIKIDIDKYIITDNGCGKTVSKKSDGTTVLEIKEGITHLLIESASQQPDFLNGIIKINIVN